jgi:hypothetical protein
MDTNDPSATYLGDASLADMVQSQPPQGQPMPAAPLYGNPYAASRYGMPITNSPYYGMMANSDWGVQQQLQNMQQAQQAQTAQRLQQSNQQTGQDVALEDRGQAQARGGSAMPKMPRANTPLGMNWGRTVAQQGMYAKGGKVSDAALVRELQAHHGKLVAEHHRNAVQEAQLYHVAASEAARQLGQHIRRTGEMPQHLVASRDPGTRRKLELAIKMQRLAEHKAKELRQHLARGGRVHVWLGK